MPEMEIRIQNKDKSETMGYCLYFMIFPMLMTTRAFLLIQFFEDQFASYIMNPFRAGKLLQTEFWILPVPLQCSRDMSLK